MFGGHAHWLKIHKRDGNGQIFLDRSETLESFKKGEIAYRPTPIGGCVNPIGCDRTPIHVLSVDCLNTDCKNLIASAKKIEKIITLKTNKIIRLKETGPASAEIRIEEAELKILESGISRARKLSNQHEG